ncbi:MAG: FG-GAP-like repeat-containing protein [Bacteroidota bacterium]
MKNVIPQLKGPFLFFAVLVLLQLNAIAAVTVTSFSPLRTTANATITIKGTNFTGATSVRIAGVPSVFLVINNTTIKAIVPIDGVSGNILVTSPSGTGASATSVIVCDLVASVQNKSVTVGTGGSVTVNASVFNNGSATYCGALTATMQKYGTVSRQVSENSNLTMTAPTGAVFVAVTFANYGTTSGSAGSYAAGSCVTANARLIAESYLLGNNTAVIPATNAVFSEPCNGTAKTLTVEAVYIYKSGSTVSGQAAENTNLTLTAPSGAVFTAVTFANFGTTTGSAGSYATGSCHDDNSKAIVGNYLPGTATATIAANTTVFSDPCNGTVKTLTAEAVHSGVTQATYACADAGTIPLWITLAESQGAYVSAPVALTVSAPAQATISNAAPLNAVVGDTVKLTGTGLNYVSALTVNGAATAITGSTSTTLNFIAGAAGSGNLVLTTACQATTTVIAINIVNRFSQISTGIPGVSKSSAAWGDYDNDGDLDLALSGSTDGSISALVSGIYNYSSGSFSNINAPLTGLIYPVLAWGDYDSDGDLDLAISGAYTSEYISRIYRNNAGTFSNIGANLTGVALGGLAWGDYDNDGDLDLAISGANYAGVPFSKIYRNNAGTFTDISAGLQGLYTGTLAWADYDKDGDLDLALTGTPDNGALGNLTGVSRIYRNDAGAFNDIGAGITGVYNSSVTWGDYDNDGDPDLALIGYDGGPTNLSKIYKNNSGTFTDIGAGLAGSASGSTAWIDYDNDGDLDLAFSGHVSKVYNNSSGSFSDISAGLPALVYGTMSWGDYDGDSDLDLFLTGYENTTPASKLYRNNTITTNTAASAPTGLSTSVSGTKAVLKWNKAADAQTPANTLNYNIRVGTGSLRNNVAPSQADSLTGNRRIAAFGNIIYRSGGDTIKNLTAGSTYYWSVQAVDAGLKGGAWSAEQNFTVSAVSSFSPLKAAVNTTVTISGLGLTGTTAVAFNGVSATYYVVNSTTIKAIVPSGATTGIISVSNPVGTASSASAITVCSFTASTQSQTVVLDVSGNATVNASGFNNGSASACGAITASVQKYGTVSGQANENGSLTLTAPAGAVFTTVTFANYGVTTGSPGSYAPSGSCFTANTRLVAETYLLGNNTAVIPATNALFGDPCGGTAKKLTVEAVYTYGSAAAQLTYACADTGTIPLWLTLTDAQGAKISVPTTLTVSAPALATITNAGPVTVVTGDTVKLTGTGFSNVTALTVNGAATTILSRTAGTLYFIAGAAGSGNLVLTTACRSATTVIAITILNRFTDLNATLSGVYGYGAVAWGDYDKDGDLDLAVTGNTGVGAGICKIYSNNGGGFTDIGAGLPNVYRSALAWGDFDNDGDLDLVLAGNTGAGLICKIYRNNAGSFTDIAAGLTPVDQASVAWGDYDNDGDQDLAVCGHNGTAASSKIYNNNAGTFTDINASLKDRAVYLSSIAWGDYDNDGDLDLAVTGAVNGTTASSRIYRNTGGVFTDIVAGIMAVSGSSVAWGDVDNDGDLDLAISGFDNGQARRCFVYRNDGSDFTKLSSGLTGVDNSSLAWGDYDNDGDADLVVTGTTDGTSASAKIYTYNAGSFTAVSGTGISAVYNSFVAWGDYDNDGDLDLAVMGTANGTSGTCKIYRNNTLKVNTAPQAPAGLSTEVLGSRVVLKWNKAADVQTPANTLNYNIRVGTASLRNNVASAHADSLTGYRRIAAAGNIQYRSSGDTLNNLPGGTYYWSVQTVDAGLKGGAWGAEQSFTLSGITAFSPQGASVNTTVTITGLNLSGATAVKFNGTAAVFAVLNSSTIKAAVPAGATTGLISVTGTGRGTVSSASAITVCSFTASTQSQTVVLDVSGNATVNASGFNNGSTSACGAITASVQKYGTVSGQANENSSLTLTAPAGAVFTAVTFANYGVTTGSPGSYAQSGSCFTANTRLVAETYLLGNNTAVIPATNALFGDPCGGTAKKLTVEAVYTYGSASAQLTYACADTGTKPLWLTLTDAQGVKMSAPVTLTISEPRVTVTNSLPLNAFVNDTVKLTGTGFDNVTSLTVNGISTAIIARTAVTLSFISAAEGAGSAVLSTACRISASVIPINVLKLFADTATGLPGISYSSVAWGDYDSDGDLDVVLSGKKDTVLITAVYRNSFGTFTDIHADLPGIQSGSVAWGDYDRDGDLDLLLTGFGDAALPYSNIYKNDSGQFVNANAGLSPLGFSNGAWNDYDNDGDLDILLAGSPNDTVAVATVLLYNNVSGVFTIANAGTITPVLYAKPAFGDYDNDGDPDLIITGTDNDERPTTRLYRNTAGVFNVVNTDIANAFLGSVAWADYDNDGDLDILITGYDDNFQALSKVYSNTAGVFTDIAANIEAITGGQAAWGDYDNNGSPDILLAGFNGTVPVSNIYSNIGGVFNKVNTELAGTYFGTANWADYDNDGRLDIFLTGWTLAAGGVETSRLYKNNVLNANTKPVAPDSIASVVEANSALLKWNRGSDAETPSGGLSYSIRVGTGSGGEDIMLTKSFGSSFRATPAIGSIQYGLAGYKLNNLAPGTYYWSIQSVDAGLTGSNRSQEKTFIISSPLPVSLISFTGTSKQGFALLNWKTVREQNNKGFEIERSTDGKTFQTAGFVKGAGNSNTMRIYKYTDAMNADHAYYRLKQTDTDGKFMYSNVIFVSGASNEVTIMNAAPNPFSDMLNLSIYSPGAYDDASLQITNSKGQLIESGSINLQKGVQQHSVNLAAHPQGVYIVTLINAGGICRQKVVKY